MNDLEDLGVDRQAPNVFVNAAGATLDTTSWTADQIFAIYMLTRVDEPVGGEERTNPMSHAVRCVDADIDKLRSMIKQRLASMLWDLTPPHVSSENEDED